MTKKYIAVLLVFCLCLSLVPMVSAEEPTLQNSVNMEQLVEHGISLFCALEAGGSYSSVVNTSLGCVGMGIMGWINSAALQLLRWCCTPEKGGDPDYCRAILGEDLFNEVMNAPDSDGNLMPYWNYWRYKTFSEQELDAARTLLGSELGIRVQNNLAALYITRQAQNGWDAGVRTEAGLLYYCSAENHYGTGAVKTFMRNVRNALGLSEDDLILSLDEFHYGVVLAAEAGTVSTLDYRTKVYNYLTKTLGLPSGPEEASDPIPFTDMPDEDNWAYDAIVWAYSNGITAGTSATTFSPNKEVTTSEMLTFLWAFTGRFDYGVYINPFSDVTEDDYFFGPVLWAYYSGILVGNEGSGSQLLPATPCSRAYVVTYLYRYLMCEYH